MPGLTWPPPMPLPAHPTRLVIGYGNALRRDDGAGPAAAALLESRALPGLSVHTCHQLTPELAERLREVVWVAFLDASLHPGDTIQVRRIGAEDHQGWAGHAGRPQILLAWARCLHGPLPEAWSVGIPARDLGWGFGLSPFTQRSVESAVAWVQDQVFKPGHPQAVAHPARRWIRPCAVADHA